MYTATPNVNYYTYWGYFLTDYPRHYLAEALQIDAERALDLLYSTKTYSQLSDPKSGMQLMSDQYILENILAELKQS